MSRRTLALLQAAFAAAIASCAAPSAPPSADPARAGDAKPPEPTALAPSADSTPTAPPSATSAAPEMPPPPTATPPGSVVVIGAPNERRLGQRCLGSVVAGLHPRDPVDSLELRFDYRPAGPPQLVVTGRRGVPCSRATNRAACMAAFEAVRPTPNGESFVFTRGDEVGIVSGGAVGAFLAPIDSPEEAAATLVYDPPKGKVDVDCAPETFSATSTGFQGVQHRWDRCDEDVTTYAVSRDGKTRRVGSKRVTGRRPCIMPVHGRRPDGLCPSDRVSVESLGDLFAEASELESVSVVAFSRLEGELRALGAPRSLQRRARRAARDEARHTRLMRVLAVRFGGAPGRRQISRPRTRPLVEIAIENAVEGCVLETWAALLARYQAVHARDAEIRTAMLEIARDEAKHAALAWDVAAYLRSRLLPEEAARVRAAYDEARRDLLAGGADGECAGERGGADEGDLLDSGARALAGLPSPEVARELRAAWQRISSPFSAFDHAGAPT